MLKATKVEHSYDMTSHAPFSVIVGGLARFQDMPTQSRRRKGPKVAVAWVLRDTETGQTIRATQHAYGDHEALYGRLVTDAPIQKGRVYETLSVSAPSAGSVSDAKHPSSPSRNRLGLARGTHVMTARGEVAVEHIKPGDKVITRDHGLQTVRYVGQQRCTVSGDSAPVMLRAGVIRNGRDLIVSADTRVVVKGTLALETYGVKEVFVPARHMVDGTNVVRGVEGKLTFFQIVTDRHEVIYAEAAAVESFMADEAGLLALDVENRVALCTALPSAPESYGPAARGFVDTIQ